MAKSSMYKQKFPVTRGASHEEVDAVVVECGEHQAMIIPTLVGGLIAPFSVTTWRVGEREATRNMFFCSTAKSAYLGALHHVRAADRWDVVNDNGWNVEDFYSNTHDGRSHVAKSERWSH